VAHLRKMPRSMHIKHKLQQLLLGTGEGSQGSTHIVASVSPDCGPELE